MSNPDHKEAKGPIDWSIPQRQAPVGLVLFSLDTVRKLVKAVWPFLIIVFFRGGDGDKDQLYFWMTIAGTVFIIVNALLSFWYFKFQIVNDEFVVKKGYLKKIKLSIPFDRIQTINIKQNIIQKILGVVALELDTAGGKDAEIKLIAIKEQVALELKQELELGKKEQSSLEDDFDLDVKDATDTDQPNQKSLLFRLDVSDLIKVGLTENHLRSFFIVFGLVYGLYYQVKDVFEEEAEQFAQESYQTLEGLSYEIYFWIAGFVLIFSVLISFVRIVFKFYNLSIVKSSKAFKIKFGLLSTKEINVPISKIQIIVWHKNPLRQLLKFQTLKIKQASSDENVKAKQSIEIPACQLKHRQDIEKAIFSELDMDFSELFSTHWFYFVKQFLIVSGLLILPSVFFLYEELYYWLALAGVELFMGIMLFLAYKKRRFRISENQIEISRGAIAEVVYKLQNYKIQSIAFRQSILVKRRGLADIVVYTAAGENLKIPYIPEELAKDVYNFLLYKVESTEKPWM